MKKVKSGEIKKALIKADRLYANNVTKQATQLYEQILTARPNCYQALNNLGLIMQSSGNIGKAEILFRQAMRADPDAPEAYNNLGNIANTCGRADKALDLYSKALALKPDYYEALFNKGAVYQQLNQLEAAISSYKQALSISPEYKEACCNLGIALQETGASEEALKYFEKALSIDPENALAKHLAASLHGKLAKTPPKEYVKGLFDGFAENFENILVDELEYSIPAELKSMVSQLSPESKELNILDLGCGTGLVGECFIDIKHELVGVDISEKMISEAHKKNIYDSLYTDELIEFLLQNTKKYDLVIAADVFVYLGDLSEIFSGVRNIIETGAYFAFSVEGLDRENEEFVLRSTGRFAHSSSYIESLARTFKFDVADIKRTNVRKEKSEWIPGYCYILENSEES